MKGRSRHNSWYFKAVCVCGNPSTLKENYSLGGTKLVTMAEVLKLPKKLDPRMLADTNALTTDERARASVRCMNIQQEKVV